MVHPTTQSLLTCKKYPFLASLHLLSIGLLNIQKKEHTVMCKKIVNCVRRYVLATLHWVFHHF